MPPKESLLAGLLRGRASSGADLPVHLSEREGPDLHHKMRQAYWWITNNAVICPYYDLEFGSNPQTLRNSAGDELLLHDDMSYSSFVLIPMLTLFTCRRALMIGGPGRGKTTSAILMSLLSGMSFPSPRSSLASAEEGRTLGSTRPRQPERSAQCSGGSGPKQPA